MKPFFIAAFFLLSAQVTHASNIGMWIWNPGVIAEMKFKEAQERLFSLASQYQIDTFYVDIEHMIGPFPDLFETALVKLEGNENDLKKFLAAAHDHHISVELLIGGERYLNLNVLVKKVESTLNWINSNKAQVSAIHLDIEPHTSYLWRINKRGMMVHFINLLHQVATRTHAANLPLHVDIPISYDLETLEHHGNQRKFHEWVMDEVDGAVLMDYRNNESEIMEMGKNEIDYAQQIGKPITLGFETNCNVENRSKISFCDSGLQNLLQIMVQLRSRLDPRAVNGFAIHDLVGLYHFDNMR